MPFSPNLLCLCWNTLAHTHTRARAHIQNGVSCVDGSSWVPLLMRMSSLMSPSEHGQSVWRKCILFISEHFNVMLIGVTSVKLPLILQARGFWQLFAWGNNTYGNFLMSCLAFSCNQRKWLQSFFSTRQFFYNNFINSWIVLHIFAFNETVVLLESLVLTYF